VKACRSVDAYTEGFVITTVTASNITWLTDRPWLCYTTYTTQSFNDGDSGRHCLRSMRCQLFSMCGHILATKLSQSMAPTIWNSLP